MLPFRISRGESESAFLVARQWLPTQDTLLLVTYLGHWPSAWDLEVPVTLMELFIFHFRSTPVITGILLIASPSSTCFHFYFSLLTNRVCVSWAASHFALWPRLVSNSLPSYLCLPIYGENFSCVKLFRNQKARMENDLLPAQAFQPS